MARLSLCGPRSRLLTSVQALERLIGEEAQPRVGNDPQHGGRESVVEGLQALFSGDADEDVKDVAVPAGQRDERVGCGQEEGPPASTEAQPPPGVRRAGGWMRVLALRNTTASQKPWHWRGGQCVPQAVSHLCCQITGGKALVLTTGICNLSVLIQNEDFGGHLGGAVG